MKSGDVMMSQLQGIQKLGWNHCHRLVNLLFADGQTVELCMVKFLFIFFHSLVTLLTNLIEHLLNSGLQLGVIQMWALCEL